MTMQKLLILRYIRDTDQDGVMFIHDGVMYKTKAPTDADVATACYHARESIADPVNQRWYDTLCLANHPETVDSMIKQQQFESSYKNSIDWRWIELIFNLKNPKLNRLRAYTEMLSFLNYHRSGSFPTYADVERILSGYITVVEQPT